MRLLASVFVVLVTIAAASGAFAATVITDARVGEREDGATRFVLDVSRATGFQLFTLGKPYRVVVDMPDATWALSRTAIPVGRGAIKAVRFGRFNQTVSRIVLDLSAPVSVEQAYLVPPKEGWGHRIVIEMAEVAPRAFREATLRLGSGEVALAARQLDQPEPAPSAESTAEAQPSAADDPVGAVLAGPSNEAANKVPSASGTSEQDGGSDGSDNTALVVPDEAVDVPEPPPGRPGGELPLVVVDPGHGGADPGAVAPDGVLEKTITLEVGLELARQLRRAGYPVRLTRTTDRYVSLSDRVEFARDVGAGLFVSLHADSHPDGRVQGASIYTLSDKASDKEAERLAHQENKADIVNGVDLSNDYDEEVTQILISLVQQSTMNCSATFAAMLVPALGNVAHLLGRTHRFAGFRVLKAPDVPSVLVEMGYLSNSKERRRLRDGKHLKALATEIVRAIDRFVDERDC